MNADEIAERAVKKVFAILGVDIEKPQDIEDFRKGLRFADSARRMAGKGVVAVFIASCLTILGLVGIGILQEISRLKDLLK